MKHEPIKEVTKDALIKRADASLPILHAMVGKGIFSLYKREINRFELDTNGETSLNALSEPQQEAYAKIKECFSDKDTVLLHGVTSSGKTEVYTHIINDALQQGQQALYLVPEIALTTQLTKRLQRISANGCSSITQNFPTTNASTSGNGFSPTMSRAL